MNNVEEKIAKNGAYVVTYDIPDEMKWDLKTRLNTGVSPYAPKKASFKKVKYRRDS